MIKAVVKIPFRDKETGKVYKKGTMLELTPKRFIDIIRKGDLVEVVENTKLDKKEQLNDGK